MQTIGKVCGNVAGTRLTNSLCAGIFATRWNSADCAEETKVYELFQALAGTLVGLCDGQFPLGGADRLRVFGRQAAKHHGTVHVTSGQ
jgi:hypothetical protein